MKKYLEFYGVIRDLSYCTRVLTEDLDIVEFDRFDINRAPKSGILQFADSTSLGFSQWGTPKLHRTHPGARMYKTYDLPKIVTVIPIIKDEGNGTQNNDRINFMVLSRMNLMNIYIVLAWYESAVPKGDSKDKITDFRFNSKWVADRILDIKNYKKSALHWNVSHFDRHFERVFRQAIRCNLDIANRYDVELHPVRNHLRALDKYLVDGKFELDAFDRHSSRKSSSSARSEAVTIHELEDLDNKQKAYFELDNLIGGKYFLAADGAFWERGKVVIQESKTSKDGKLPSLADIQDGLFRNILCSNIDELYLDGVRVDFTTRLKLTGKVVGTIEFPTNDWRSIESFADENKLRSDQRLNQRLWLRLLNEEAIANKRVTVEIAPKR